MRRAEYAGTGFGWSCKVICRSFGVDYDETFAPVVDFEVVLLIVSYFVRINAHIHHADIVTAFLNGDIDGGSVRYLARESVQAYQELVWTQAVPRLGT